MIQFSKSGVSSLQLYGGRSFPSTDELQSNQILSLTENGNAKVLKLGNETQFIDLQFDGLPRDSYDGVVNGLRTWFKNSAIDFSVNSFTLTTEDGETLTVRLWDNSFKVSQTANNTFSVRLKLKVE